MSHDDTLPKTRFLADRMLGALARYLRFMGYDTVCANSFEGGDPREDTRLLALARAEHRILLTRDRELTDRGGEMAVYILRDDVLSQVQQLTESGIVECRLAMTRCSICNTVLREATKTEIGSAPYAPSVSEGYMFFWCSRCGRLYWNGTHQRHIKERISSLPGRQP